MSNNKMLGMYTDKEVPKIMIYSYKHNFIDTIQNFENINDIDLLIS